MSPTASPRVTPFRRACEAAVLAGLALILVDTWFVSRHVVATGSMMPTLAAGDRVLVDRAAFELRSPRRWEIVAFQRPTQLDELAVKRIVALPGERVQIVDGHVYVDGQQLTSPRDTVYGPPSTLYESAGCDAPYQLSDDEYFVLGDDPANSVDSRYLRFGPAVPAKLLVGKPFFRYGSTARWHVGPLDIQVPDFGRIGYIR